MMQRVIHITDPHLFSDTSKCMRGINTYESLQRVVAHAKENHDASAWLVTGDVAQDESIGAYKIFRDVLNGIDVPVLCLAGNHDNPSLMTDALDNGSWVVSRNLDLGNWCICPVDSRIDGQAGGAISPDNMQALDACLQEHASVHLLVALHHQALDMGSRWLDGVGLTNHQELVALLEQHSSVRGVVWGHVHQASDRTVNAIRFLSTPSTCSQFLPRADRFELDDRPPGYRWLDLGADGSLDTGVVWVS